MQLKINADYLLIPVNRTAESVACRLKIHDCLVRHFDCRPCAPEIADFTAFYPVKEFRDQILTVETADNNLPADFVDWISQTNTPAPQNSVTESIRPQLHFSSRRGWLNDPNGLFFYNGQYHMFYQHNPFSVDWGNMTWGHAVSTDLIHWHEFDDAIFPDESGTIFSGSAVVDHANTSGLGNGQHPPILLFYTVAGNHAPIPTTYTQNLVFSTDGGTTFQKYSRNPLIPELVQYNRDPKVVRQGNRWVLALYLEKRGEEHYFGLFESDNLLEWKKFQELTLPGTGECPDLYELPLDGNADDGRWVFGAADGKYLIGHFINGLFVTEAGPFDSYCRQGSGNFYAAQSWDNISDGRRIQLAWHLANIPSPKFNMSMGLSVELALKTFSDGIRLCAEPVNELQELCAETQEWQNFSLAEFTEDQTVKIELAEIVLDAIAEQPVTLNIRGLEIVCNPVNGTIRCADAVLQQTESQNHFQIRLVLDRTSVELFAERGRIYAGKRILFFQDNQSISLHGANADVRHYSIRHLHSIWE